MGWFNTGGRGLETAAGLWVFVVLVAAAAAFRVWHEVTIGSRPPPADDPDGGGGDDVSDPDDPAHRG